MRGLVLAILFSCLGMVHADDRQPIPAKAAQQEADELVNEVFGKEISGARTPDTKLALTKKLLEESAKPNTRAEGRYALLKVALGVAPDAKVAMSVIDDMAKQFQIEAMQAKAYTLKEMSAITPSERKALAESAVELADSYIEQDNFPAASALIDIALDAATKSRDSQLIRDVRAKKKDVSSLEKKYADVELAIATLGTDPADAKSNSIVGKYKCFVKGEWEDGLPMLALGEDAVLKELATKELVGAKASDEQVALADSWYDLSQNSDNANKEQMTQRAMFWYQAALKSTPALSTLVKAKIEKRLDELKELFAKKTAVAAVKPIDLLSRVNIERDVKNGLWKLISGSLVCPTRNLGNNITFPYPLPAQYDLYVTVERQPGHRGKPINYDVIVILGWQNRSFLAVIEGWGAGGNLPSTGLHKVDGKEALSNETTVKGPVLTDGKPCDVICRVRNNRVMVICDGKQVIDWTGNLQRLGAPVTDGTKPQLGIATRISSKISRVTLNPVADEPKRD